MTWWKKSKFKNLYASHEKMKNSELKVLIIGSEPHSRRLVVAAMEQVEGLRVVSTATSGSVALARLHRSDVDMVVLDMESADNEALDTLSRIHGEFPGTGIVVIGDPDSSGPDRTVKALEAGAIDFIARPTENPKSLQDFTRQCRVLAGMLRNRMSFQRSRSIPVEPRKGSMNKSAVGSKREETRRRLVQPEKSSPRVIKKRTLLAPPRIDAVAIGISTGGPNALLDFIPLLKRGLGIPIFLVQHMPKHFTAPLAESLNKRSVLSVKEAEHDEIIAPDTVYVAPGGLHMVIHRDFSPGGELRIVLNDNPPVNSCRPSADVLFSSVARAYGRHVLAVVMTGMGGDGMRGAGDVREGGGYCISQSEDTCVVYGMPKAVNDAGISNETVPLDQMALRVMGIVRGERREGP